MSITETKFHFRDGMDELKKVDYLIVHHTASTRDMTAAEIHAEHLNLGELTKQMLERALERNNGNRKLAAKELGISDRTLYRRLKQYGLEP